MRRDLNIKIRRFFMKIVGVLLILSFFLPIPTGLLRVAMGFSMLVCSSLRFALLVQGLRKRYAFVNNSMTWFEDKMG